MLCVFVSVVSLSFSWLDSLMIKLVTVICTWASWSGKVGRYRESWCHLKSEEDRLAGSHTLSSELVFLLRFSQGSTLNFHIFSPLPEDWKYEKSVVCKRSKQSLPK